MEALLATAGAVLVLGGALAMLVKGGKWMLGTARKLARLADEVLGDEERPGWGKRLTAIERRLSNVEAQVTPNGGRSMHDKVNATLAAVTGTDER